MNSEDEIIQIPNGFPPIPCCKIKKKKIYESSQMECTESPIQRMNFPLKR